MITTLRKENSDGGSSADRIKRDLRSDRSGRHQSPQSDGNSSCVYSSGNHAADHEFHRRGVPRLLLSRLGAGIARDWLTKQLWSVEPITPADVKKAKEIIQNYTDKEFSYTDATSFAVMERLVLPAAFAFDVHFKQYGLKLLA